VERTTPIEHGRGRLGPMLRSSRRRLVLWIVLAEGLLVLLDVIPWWTVFVLAAVAFAVYVGVARGHPNPVIHETGWIAAFSQLVVVLVPVLALVLTTLAIVALVLVALGALALVVLDRR